MDYLRSIQTHFDRLVLVGATTFGKTPTGMWPSKLDCGTGQYPATEPDTPPRTYRNIDAPGGASLYWDLPSLVAAHNLSRSLGRLQWALAADAYVRAYLDRCVSQSGLWLWGNHYYWSVTRDAVIQFHGREEPEPVDPDRTDGELHELRPVRVPWELLWRHDEKAVERCIRAMGERHVFDADTGGFNRHADGKCDHAFLESGGILVESLAWLYAQLAPARTDESLAELAVRIARFSFEHRGEQTGLVENNPTSQRWDKHVCTSEIGLWAGCLLHAATLTARRDLEEMAAEAVDAYLRHAFDAGTEQYWGMVRVADGLPERERTTEYQPAEYADVWNGKFPTHDYPLPLAETCLELYRRTGKPSFGLAVQRWVRILASRSPAEATQPVYAESYGRAIHFLLRAAEVLEDDRPRKMAEQLASQAVAKLVHRGIFRGSDQKDHYAAVDGVGYLLLALLRLETGKDVAYLGMRF